MTALSEPVESLVTGNGMYTYTFAENAGQLPDAESFGRTHGGTAVSETGMVYCTSEGANGVAVFDGSGKFLNWIAPQLNKLHSLQVVKIGGEEFLLGAQIHKRAVLFDFKGSIIKEVSQKTVGEIEGGWRGLTAVTIDSEGNWYLAMGYGSNFIHKFDTEGKLLTSFGGKGDTPEKFNCPHGIKVDQRFSPPRLLVADREHRVLKHFDLEGNLLNATYAVGLRRPCAVDFYGDLCAVAELEGRVTIINKEGHLVSFLGDNPNRKQWARFNVKPAEWKPQYFIAPHGVSFDEKGNLWIQDWNVIGRLNFLKRINR